MWNKLPFGVLGLLCASYFNFISVVETKGALQQQYFRLHPISVKASVGTDVTLQCEVENVSGQVQWTKDGYALGYNHTINGLPRYRFLKDEERGIFNLFIRNVSLEDDAEFQCQVGPAVKPIIHKPLRSAANLTVISPPQTLEFIGRENNSKLEVRENHSIRLQCQAKNAKPAAKIIWYRGKTELKFDNPQENVTESSTRVNSKIKLYDVTSEIHLQPSVEDDSVNYTCEAVHDALPPKKHLRASVQLSVLYPPGLPYIEGYNEGDALRSGQNVDLICRSRGGNPPAQLVWYKNGEQIGAVYRTWGRVSENVYSFIANMTHNKARFTCEASSVINNTRLTTEVNVTVHYAPATLIINGSSEGKVGDEIPLTCSSAPSNPPVELKWNIGGKDVTNTSFQRVSSLHNGYVTHSNITVTIESDAENVVVICSATSVLGDNKLATHTITVLKPPGKPIISTQMNTSYAEAGSLQTLKCVSIDGSPLPTLKWFRNDKEIPSKVMYDKKMATAETNIYVNSSDNEAVYKCEAHNSAIDIPYFETLKLTVYFPPLHAIIKKEPPIFRAGSQGKLICDVSSSNPPATVGWWLDGLAVTEGVTEYSRPGLHGGKVVTIELHLNLSAEMDGHKYTCQAANSPLKRNIDTIASLDVMYAASIRKITDVITVGEKETATLECTVDGNPLSTEHVTWKRAGFSMEKRANFSFNNATSSLTIKDVSLDDMGSFFCVVDNGIGNESSKPAYLVVKHKPEVDSSEPLSKAAAKKGNTAKLICKASGAPAVTFSWSRNGTVLPKSQTEKFKIETKASNHIHFSSTLYIQNVVDQDYGIYGCTARNELDFDKTTVELQRPSGPDPVATLIAVNATHDSITLSWTPGFDGGETNTFLLRYSTVDNDEKPRLENAGNQTIFTIHGLRLATCYHFNIIATNSLGRSTFMKESVKACALSEGPPSLPSRGEVSNEEVNKLPFAVGLVVAFVLIILNVTVVGFCIVKRSKNKFKETSNQHGNKADGNDLYAANNFTDQMHAESITSVSEKSENYDKGYNVDEGRCSALNTYMIEEIDYPFQDTSVYEIEVKPEKLNAYHRTSTICRNGSLCQRIDASNANLSSETQFIAYPPPVQFAQPPLQYISTQRGHIPVPPPDVTVQTAQNVPLSTFNYNSELDGQLV
ncbi:nephrin-like isoform X2 [Planococcus citri]|uniref:nephrin-like isoform X2 n=1 Tax=Planococcus citri TaxID=170843 RepID=UPI0031F86BBF